MSKETYKINIKNEMRENNSAKTSVWVESEVLS